MTISRDFGEDGTLWAEQPQLGNQFRQMWKRFNFAGKSPFVFESKRQMRDKLDCSSSGTIVEMYQLAKYIVGSISAWRDMSSIVCPEIRGASSPALI
jgi:hypothetical protein